MAKTLYLDCFSGIAGDMTLAALIDLGADPEYIAGELRKLPIDPFEMEIVPVVKRGITAKYLKLIIHQQDQHVHAHEHKHHHSHDHAHEHCHGHEHGHAHHHRHDHDHPHTHHHHGDGHHHEHRRASDIIAMIRSSQLPPRVIERSIAIFQVIAEAEGKIHGLPPEDVHFHEVGAMDSIIDIIGVCIALEHLGIDRIIASPVPVGHGRMKMAHGLYPIPAPATLELLRGIPLSGLTVEGELTTPTGAGILRVLANDFGPLPAMQVDRIGYGAGVKDFAHPNVIRAILLKEAGGKNFASVHGEQELEESIIVLEAQLDDASGETLGYAMEQLFAAGALDVYYTPVYMKKNRPGTLITVLVHPDQAEACENLLFAETSTFGVRRSIWTRKALGRRWLEVETPYGKIRVKQALRNGTVIRSSPEYEDVAAAARQYGVPLHVIYEEARKQV